MDSSGRLFSQVAAEAKVAAEKAMAACYLRDLSRAGRTLNDAGQLMRTSRAGVRTIARNWGIDFPDYSYGTPIELSWRRLKPGHWALEFGGDIVANAIRVTRNGTAFYEATAVADGLSDAGSSAEVACRRLSLAMEEFSLKYFGVDDVLISMDGFGVLAPKPKPLAPLMQKALAA